MDELSADGRLGLLRQGDAAQEAFDHPQAQPPLHPVKPVIATFAPSIVASQAGASPLDARTPPIPAFPRARVFQRLAFPRELARGWDGHPLDSGGFQLFLRFRRMHASVARHQTRRMCKEGTVVRHRLHRLPMFGGVREDLVARHDAALDFIDALPHQKSSPAVSRRTKYFLSSAFLHQPKHLLVPTTRSIFSLLGKSRKTTRLGKKRKIPDEASSFWLPHWNSTNNTNTTEGLVKSPLSSQARRELVERMAPQYQAASRAQKMLLLDTFVALTGYVRKYAMWLLNHPVESRPSIRHARPVHYGPDTNLRSKMPF